MDALRPRRYRRFLVLAIMSLCALACPRLAAAEDDAVARATVHFERGIELYQDKDFNAALSEFRRAFALAPNYRLHYNIAIALSRMHKYVEAIAEFERYLEGANPKVDGKTIALVHHEVERLSERLASVAVQVNVPNAVVEIDGVAQSPAAVQERVVVSMGERQVRVTADGYQPVSQTVQLAAGEHRELQIALMEKSLEALPLINDLRTDLTTSSKREARKTSAWIATGFTVALVAGAGVTGYLAWDGNRDLDVQLARPAPSPGEVASTRGRVRTFALTADIFTVAALASGAVSWYLWSRDDPKSEQRVSTSLHVGPNALVLGGVF